MNKKTVSIGIAAYNAEKNIGHILKSLLEQKEENFIIQEIIVNSDASTDRTIEIAESFKESKIKALQSTARLGFGGSIKKLLEIATGDIVILLNDDIKILDHAFISKLLPAFDSSEKVGLVCGNPQPLKPKTFIEKAVTSTSYAYYEIRKHINNGNSNYSCDGKILALSRDFINSLSFPQDYSTLGCVDAYLYFSCISKNFKFIFVPEAVVYFRNPSTLRDYVKFVSRNDSNKELLKQIFGVESVNKEYTMPKKYYLLETGKQFLKNPVGCLAIFFIKFYTKYNSNKLSKKFVPLWETVTTTKDL